MARLASSASATRERILSAAFTLFGRYGFKRTSMEDIASEAGLSRAALYLQFRNKEEIFRDLARALHEEAISKAQAALQNDQPLGERLQAAVEAKTRRMMEIAHDSPHGSELMDAKNRLCGDLATDSERRFRDIVTRLFKHADETREIDLAAAGLTAREAAELFLHAVSGLKDPSIAIDVYRRRVATLASVFVAGISGRG